MRISDWSSDVCSSDLNGVSAFFGIAPGMSTISGDDDGKIAASRPRSGERAVRKSGLIGESGDLALRRLLDQAGGGGGANLLITVFDDFITQATDRKSVVSGKSVEVRVDLGGVRIIKKIK